MNRTQANFRLMQLWIEAAEGQASDAELVELNNIITSDPDAREVIFELSQQQGSLKWAAGRTPGLGIPAMADEQTHVAVGLSELELKEVGELVESSFTSRAIGCPLPPARQATLRTPLRDVSVPLVSMRMAMLAAGLMAVAYLAASLLSRGEQRVAVQATPSPAQDIFHAEVISSTPCLWTDSQAPLLSLGQQYQEGDTITLLEGVAELRVASRAGETSIQLEGPVACALGTDGVVNLRYGKVSLDNRRSNQGSFVVETPFGRVLVSPGAEIGISAFGSIAEVHVFHGSAALDSPWLVSEVGELTSQAIASRKAIRIAQDDNSVYEFTVIDADRSHFSPQVSAGGNMLAVPQAYVNAVKESSPVAYWRFDGTEGERVRNEMGDAFVGHLSGDYRWIGPEDNRGIEFGVLPHPGMLRVEESWNEVLSDDFAFEFWMKPSHFHHGTIISFAGPFNWNLKKNPLGIAVETMGGWGDGARTNRIRFLVREPIGYVEDSSTYTDHLYQPGYWQHVAVTKEGDAFNTYVDGKLVETATGISETPRDLQLIIGKLYTDELYRPFIGCLDEIAIYDRALLETEVEQHASMIPLGRNSSNSSGTW